MHKYLLVLSVLLGVVLLVIIAQTPVTSYSFELRSDASPVGTAIDAPTPTDCPRCVPVGTPIPAYTDTPSVPVLGH